MSAKHEAKRIIDLLPENASFEDIMHALYVRAKFARGEREIRSGKGVPHREAKERMRRWID